MNTPPKVVNPQFLRECRRRIRLSQMGLAVRIGVAMQSIQNWETGRVRPHDRHVLRLADAFGITADELFSAIDGEPVAA